MCKKILLVEPDFPIPPKSKNHKNFLPIGLLKLASYYKAKGYKVKLVRGELHISDFDFIPDEINITSLFTYWAPYVKKCVKYYRKLFPKAKIIVGGIYASLLPEHCLQYTGCDEIYQGVHKEAEKYYPAYDLIENQNPHSIDYQIIHTSRGCTRKCKFCGTWKIEPNFESKKSIKNEIKKKKIVFYDNNLLMNEYIENILQELIELKKEKKILWCESQSGFDGRILMEKPYLASMLKKAGFRYPRIAWDWGYKDYSKIEKQLKILMDAGYSNKDLFVFMLYNWDIPFEEMEQKRIKCWKWRVQIADCRYRPLTQTYDFYNPRKPQTSKDYYIHPNWTDALVKQFRKNVRRQNICVRQNLSFYSKAFEVKKVDKKIILQTKNMKDIEVKKLLDKLDIDYWFPDVLTDPMEYDLLEENNRKINLKIPLSI